MAATQTAGDTTFNRTPPKVLSIEERNGVRVYRYRWTFSGGQDAAGKPLPARTGEDWAYAPIDPLPRSILEDRWAGLMAKLGEATRLQERLDRVLNDLQEGVTRRESGSETVLDDEIVPVDLVMDLNGLQTVIREWILDRAAKVALR
jgi:hypothetical protein